jgi:hypothetical protein
MSQVVEPSLRGTCQAGDLQDLASVVNLLGQEGRTQRLVPPGEVRTFFLQDPQQIGQVKR